MLLQQKLLPRRLAKPFRPLELSANEVVFRRIPPETNLGTISMTRTASDRGRHAIPSASPIMISPGRTQISWSISWSTKLRRTGTSTALKSHFSVALLAKDLVVTWADIPLPHLLWRLLGRKSENPVSRKGSISKAMIREGL